MGAAGDSPLAYHVAAGHGEPGGQDGGVPPDQEDTEPLEGVGDDLGVLLGLVPGQGPGDALDGVHRLFPKTPNVSTSMVLKRSTYHTRNPLKDPTFSDS